MKIEVIDTQRGDIYLIKIEGRLNANFCYQLEDEVDKLLEQKTKSIILDFSAVTYLSSSGLRVLLSINKQTEGNGGLVLVNLRNTVKKFIEVAEMDDLLIQAETVEEAMEILEAKKKS
jgi:anti-sigma B factor antagonist